MLGGDGFDPVKVGAKGTGLVLAGLLVYRTFVFVCNFLAGRYDARQARVEALDDKVSKSLAKRLDHLERTEKTHQQRISSLEGWLGAIAAELRKIDPENPRLKEMAESLRLGFPVPPPEHGLGDLLQTAATRVERRSKR